jgi:UDP-glucuronate 4-epimerase
MATLITGASGFVGLALTEHLLAQGQQVVGFDLALPPKRTQQLFASLPGRYEAIQGDVRDSEPLTQALRRCGVDALVALAAVTADAERERRAPQSIFDVNVGSVLSAVSASALCGVKRILLGSSGSVYGATGMSSARLDEVTSQLRPEGLYGISKMAAELASLRLAQLHGVHLVVGRLGTCFGPWEAATGVRDTLSAPLQVLQLAREGHAAVLPREGRRDWLYIRDAAAALAALIATTSLQAPVYNLAAGFEWTVAQWCEEVAKWYPDFTWHLARPGETANVTYYADYDRSSLSIDRLLADTPFTPRFDLAAAAADFRLWDANA